MLLYGCWTSTPYRRQIKALETFHIRCLKSILGIRWWHKAIHVETCRRAADIKSAERLLLQRQLRWLGHVIRMLSYRIPRRLLNGELLNCQRLSSGSKLRLKDHIRRVLNNATFHRLICRQWRATEASGKISAAMVSMHFNMSRIKRLITDVPAGIMQPRQHQLDESVHTAAASVPPSLVSVAIFASTLLVLLNSPTTINVLVELDSLQRERERERETLVITWGPLPTNVVQQNGCHNNAG